MRKSLSLLLLLSLVLCLCAAAHGEDAAVSVTGHVLEIEKYGHARLDLTIEEFNSAGFALGDVVTVQAGSFTGDMPYLNGYYVESGEYMLRAYPGHEYIAVCINYGRFADAAGVDVGDEVTLTLKEKAGALALQEIYNLVYTTDRADYASDEVFANFRMVTAGDIAPERLYRSASPVDNQYGRAAYALPLVRDAGVRSVLNLANTPEWLDELFSSDNPDVSWYRELYEAGQVIPLGLPTNYGSDEFAGGIVRGLTFLSEHDAPYLVHCTEGKDRAGFTSMVLEALMGASVEEMEADYMLSFTNYYGIQPGTERYELIAAANIREMMCSVAGLDKRASLEGVDMQAAAVNWLQAHGMAPDAIAALQEKLR